MNNDQPSQLSIRYSPLIDSFPELFCSQLNDDEFQNWASQIVISNAEVSCRVDKRSASTNRLAA